MHAKRASAVLGKAYRRSTCSVQVSHNDPASVDRTQAKVHKSKWTGSSDDFRNKRCNVGIF